MRTETCPVVPNAEHHELQVVITSQLATKLLKPDGSAANFETGSRAIMAPALGLLPAVFRNASFRLIPVSCTPQGLRTCPPLEHTECALYHSRRRPGASCPSNLIDEVH